MKIFANPSPEGILIPKPSHEYRLNETKGLILHNLMDSASNIQNSILGPNGTIVGNRQYLPNIYGYGTVMNDPLNHNSGGCSHYVSFPATILNPDHGRVEAWILVNEGPYWAQGSFPGYEFYWIYNGPWDNGEAAKNIRLYLSCQTSDEPTYKYLGFTATFGGGANNWSCAIRWLGNFDSGWEYYKKPTHVAAVWDRNGINGDTSKCVALFINGVEVDYYAPPTQAGTGFGTTSTGQLQCTCGSWYRTGEGADDYWNACNYKIYDYANLDFSDIKNRYSSFKKYSPVARDFGSATKIHGEVSGAQKSVEGLNQKCYYFDGSDDYIKIIPDSSFDQVVGSINIYCKSIDNAAESYFLSLGKDGAVAGTDHELSFKFDWRVGVKKLYFFLHLTNSTLQWSYSVDCTPYDGVWIMITIVQNGTAPVFYINGKQISMTAENTTDTTKWFGDLYNTSPYIDTLYIGQRLRPTGTSPFNGLIQNLEFIDDILTPWQVQMKYYNGLNKRIHTNKGLILWNKLGSITEVGDSDVGFPLSIVNSMDFYTGRFYKGAQCGEANSNETFNSYLSYNATKINPEKGCVEFWINLTALPASASREFYSFINGSYESTKASNIMMQYSCSPGVSGGNVPTLHYSVYFNGTGVGYWKNVNLALSTDHHLAMVWDRNGIDGTTDTVRLYLNGVLFDKVTSTNNWGTSSTSVLKMATANFEYADGQFAGGMLYSMSNIKIWNYAKTNFKDKDIEKPVHIFNPNVLSGRKLLLHNLMGGQTEIENSLIGPDGFWDNAEAELTTEAFKFDNGYKHPKTGADAYHCKVAFDMLKAHVHTRRGCIEYWWKSCFTDGEYNYGNAYRGFFDGCDVIVHPPNPAPLRSFYVKFSTDRYYTSRPTWRLVMGAYGATSLSIDSASLSVPQFSTNDIIHIAMCWDKDGIPGKGGKTVILFMNAVEVLSSTSTAWDDGIWPCLWLSSHCGTSFNNPVRTLGYPGVGGVHDNLKIWNYAKTDFSDIEREMTKDISKFIL